MKELDHKIYAAGINFLEFNISQGTPPKEIYFFESPIDLLSYWSLNKKMRVGADLQGTRNLNNKGKS
ncbi:hypothetical protein [Bacillus altitudinis]|uniref:hypothetical protein n=1 Tax=Bacillus altitudinis TaxID=293387 RepID=UPI002EC4D67F|nr:hypothetical protein [Bacillus altitudinis]MEE3613499.1 hypothetical protein [Bacillus altitudinis]MEE3649113.1 hypothetical protein [Bacillus altitudinis]MEE4393534.1 hypothetical protein [Bacillus altitudinis]MEE4397233.1 hypothetical protein [Bacillus altitudinis]